MNRILLFFALIVPVLSDAQGFRRRHYLPGIDWHLSKAIYELNDGSYLAAGLVVEVVNNVQTNRLCIMGLDAQGQLLWSKKHGNSKFEYLNNNLVTKMFYKDGNNLYFAGCARDSNNVSVGVLIKFNLSGDTVWRKIYRDPTPQTDVIPQMVTRGVDGGFLITGFFQTYSGIGSRLLMLIKTDSNGNELWRQMHGKVFPNAQDGKAIVQDVASKAIIIVGYQYIGTSQTWWSHDNVVLLDSLGAFKARSNFAGYGGILVDLIQTSDQKLVAVGQKIYQNQIGGTNLIKSFAMKFSIDVQNSSIQNIWKLDGFGPMVFDNFFTGLKEMANGDLMICGVVDTLQVINQPTNTLTRLTRISANGVVLSSRYYNYKNNLAQSDNNQVIHTLEPTADGGWIAAIECINFQTVNPMFFVKYDSTGCDSTTQYCQEQLAAGLASYGINSLKLRCYPNPMGDRLIVEVPGQTGTASSVEFQLLDVRGRVVRHQSLVFSDATVDLVGLEPGVYMGRAQRQGQTVYSVKLVKTR